MPRLRAVLVRVPPLVGDLIRHVLIARSDLLVVAELTDMRRAGRRLRDLAPDVVIIGPAPIVATQPGHPLSAGRVRSILPQACVVVLSADLSRLFGPGDGEVYELTAETLANCLPQQPEVPEI
jgi:chemotaxis response regulator CheB